MALTGFEFTALFVISLTFFKSPIIIFYHALQYCHVKHTVNSALAIHTVLHLVYLHFNHRLSGTCYLIDVKDPALHAVLILDVIAFRDMHFVHSSIQFFIYHRHIFITFILFYKFRMLSCLRHRTYN